MAARGLTYEEGKTIIAYIVNVLVERREKTWLIRRTQYNCWDEALLGQKGYLKQVAIRGVKLGLVSVLTLENMQRGCCPRRLMKDFIMQEGGEMAEKDPVEEAMKLHKRGYFGGGG